MSLKDTDVRTPGDEAIAKKFKLTLAKVRQLVKQGAKHEKEHNTNQAKAEEVARDHIGERPDYYKMLSKAEKTDKNHMKEESATGGVRGLGYVSGDPAGTNYIQSYLNTNAMAYEDENGNKLEFNKKNHNKLHSKKLGFKAFDPTNIENSKNFVNEGISAGIRNDPGSDVGDMGGGRTIARKTEVKEDLSKIKKKLGKAVKVGSVVGALGAHAGKVYDVGNVVSHHDDPGLATATAVSYLHPASRMLQAAPTVLKVDKAGKGENEFKRQKLYGGKKLQMKEGEDPCWKGYQQVGMKKKGGRKVPNCVPIKETGQVMSRYTERPTYENATTKGDVLPRAGGAERGIYEDWQSVNRKDKTDGLSQKAVDAYKRENPGSKLQTAVTEKDPSGKRAARRKSFCSRMGGMKKRLTSAKTARDPDSRINKALRRWNCEEEVMQEGYSKYSGKSHSLAPFGDKRTDPLKNKRGADRTLGQYTRDFPANYAKKKISKELGDVKSSIKSNLGKHTKPKHLPEEQIDEIKASTVGRAVAKASGKRKELTSKKMGDKEIKQWWKMERLVRKGTEKLTGKSKVPPSMEDEPPFFPSHERKHKKGSEQAHRLAVKAMKKQKSKLKEETMDTNNQIQEAIRNIQEENLNEMKENFLAVLQEKAMEKLEERKKEIAANYFAQ